MLKKVVHYYPGHYDHIVVGQSAIVAPIDHPDTDFVSNGVHVRTSTVLSVQDDGQFETENSVYVPIRA